MADDSRVSREAAHLAAKAGGEAFRAGEEPSACPHKGDDVPSRHRAHFWVKGYNAAASAA